MQHTVGKLTRHAGRTELTLFEADVGHAFDFHKCIRASAAVARVVADGEAVKVLARAVAKDDVFGMAFRIAPEDRRAERRKSAPLERDVADAPVGGVALRFFLNVNVYSA